MSLSTVPGLITPGQRMAQGTWYPPSQLVFFLPRNGDRPPSGEVNFSGNAVDVRGLVAHHALVVGTDVPEPISSPQITRIFGGFPAV